MRAKALSRLLFAVGVITWVALLFTDISVVFSTKRNLPAEVPTWLPGVILNLYLIALYYYYKLKIDRDDQLNFLDLLWRVFATGLVATVISLVLRLIEYLLGATTLTSNIVYIEVTYLINLGLMISFLLAAFTAWKRLILYQKSKWLLRLWAFFEYALLISLLYNSHLFPRAEWLFNALF